MLDLYWHGQTQVFQERDAPSLTSTVGHEIFNHGLAKSSSLGSQNTWGFEQYVKNTWGFEQYVKTGGGKMWKEGRSRIKKVKVIQIFIVFPS